MNLGRTVHAGLSRTLSPEGSETLFQSGAGGYVSDIQGRSYCDFVLGYGSVVLGHADESFTHRVCRSLSAGSMFPAYSAHHETLLDLLWGHLPRASSTAFFKTGSESVTAAVRLAARKTGKLGVIRCGFLGWHDVALGRSIRWHEPLTSPLRAPERYLEGFRGVEGQECVFNWSMLHLPDLAGVLDRHAKTVGAFVVDAYQSHFCGVANLQRALDLCRESGVVTILDNTKLGGRVSVLGDLPEGPLSADLTIIGKALGNGFP